MKGYIFDKMTCFFFLWGREKYSKGRVAGARGRDAGVKGEGSGGKGEGSGGWGPPVQPHQTSKPGPLGPPDSGGRVFGLRSGI